MYCCCWNTKASSPAESERSLRRLALPHSSRQSATMKPVSVLPRVPHHEVLLDDLVTVLHLAELPQSSFASSILPRSLLSTTMIRLFALWLLWHHKQVILSRLPTSHTMKHEFTVSLVEPMVKIVKLLLLLHSTRITLCCLFLGHCSLFTRFASVSAYNCCLPCSPPVLGDFLVLAPSPGTNFSSCCSCAALRDSFTGLVLVVLLLDLLNALLSTRLASSGPRACSVSFRLLLAGCALVLPAVGYALFFFWSPSHQL